MKLSGLIDLSLILILVSSSKGERWNVSLTRHITAKSGSDVTIQCRFTVPTDYRTDNVEVYWKKPVRSHFNTFDKDQNAFVFHPNSTFVLEKYRKRTKLIGNKAKGNCSLTIFNISHNEPNIYVRVIAKNNYSFKKDFVSISVSDVASVNLKADTVLPTSLQLPNFETTTSFYTGGPPQENSAPIYLAIFVPVAALLIIIVVAGTAFCIKHKRSHSFTREDSGYFATFSRASSNQAKRDASCKKQEKRSELKAIDEPVYMNTKGPPDQMDQSMDHTENIYENVDYSK